MHVRKKSTKVLASQKPHFATDSQNDVKMYAEIIEFSCFYGKGENTPNYLFYNRRRGSGHLKMEEKTMKHR